jgi:phosphoribosylanthranilate isomerase
LQNTDKINGRVFLSGGLNSRNVKSAIKKLHPEWIDASSSLEAKPGKKDHKKIQQFIKAVKK